MKSSCSRSSRAKTSSLISAMICRWRSKENAKVLPSRIAVTSEMAERYCVSKVSSCTLDIVKVLPGFGAGEAPDTGVQGTRRAHMARH